MTWQVRPPRPAAARRAGSGRIGADAGRRAWPPMRLLVVLAIAVSASAPSATASDDTWRNRKHGTGGWNGLREAWVEHGFVLGGFYVFDALGNPSGGLERSTAYAGHLELDLSLDLDRLLDLDGLALDVAVSWASGANLSDDIGNVFQVGEAYSGRTVRLTRLYVEQTMARGKLFLKLGRISAGNDFAVLPANVYHVNAGINGNPLSISLNEPGFFTDPVAQWGLRLLARPNDRLRFRVAAYNPDPTVGEEGNNGLDFSFDPSDGVLVMTEVAYRLDIEVGGDVYRGLYKAGAYLDSSELPHVDDEAVSSSGQYGVYLMAQQEVLHEQREPTGIALRPFFGRHIVRTAEPIHVTTSHQGLTPWIAIALSPRQEISTVPVYVAGGLLYRGLVEGRGDDHTGLAVYHGRFSDRLPDRASETVIELNHSVQATPWLYVTPDLQVVLNPGGTDIPTALVLGIEVGVTF